jgi:hypothetical protein
MYFIFGLMSIRSNKFTPDQVGINSKNNEYKDHLFLIKKRCFHLFWIPIFPTETQYILKNEKTKEKHVMPDVFKWYIQEHYVKRREHPFWTFSGMWLLLVAIMFFFGMLTYKNYRRDMYYEETAKNRATYVDKSIVGDYYNLYIKPKSNNNQSQKLYLVVNKLKGDSLVFVNMLGDTKVDSIQETRWLKGEIQDSLAQIAITKNYKTLTLSKEDLKNTIPTDRSLKMKQSYPIEELGDVTMYTFSSYYIK